MIAVCLFMLLTGTGAAQFSFVTSAQRNELTKAIRLKRKSPV